MTATTDHSCLVFNSTRPQPNNQPPKPLRLSPAHLPPQSITNVNMKAVAILAIVVAIAALLAPADAAGWPVRQYNECKPGAVPCPMRGWPRLT
jgi:hypothetical protein